MRALSIRQPWVWAILNAGKRVENREWDPSGGNAAAARRIIDVGGEFLIHAAKGCTLDEYEGAGDFMRDVYAAQPWEGSHIVPSLKNPALTRGAIVARVRLIAVLRVTSGGHQIGMTLPSGRCLLCGARDGLEDCPKADPWAIPGCLGLIFDDVRPLAEPVPFKGALGFFDVPASVLP